MKIKEHHYQDLIVLFNSCFAAKYNTCLIKGDEEPIYLPADETRSFHGIYFAHGFFSSALHECAHWLIAGRARRKLEDYGYWYIPDGRTTKEQQLFQQVEVKPQALEWILSVAAGYRFQFSIDNLDGPSVNIQAFKQAIYQQVLIYCQQGLPKRANLFRACLCNFYQTPIALEQGQFKLLI
ncbi:elongation factor P hydroxylase [Legionella sp. D16C41]|uniref:elongation factor P hydroxylase n=1 Tax=Legionella sp. D16C41 TaxID=3402688 RepID=UPI003AF88CA2